MSSAARGPTPQLTPTTSAPSAASAATASRGRSPAEVVSPATKSSATTTGRSVTARAARRAWRASVSEGKVSNTSRSTPPSTSAPICSRKASRACSAVSAPSARSRPMGPDGAADEDVEAGDLAGIAGDARGVEVDVAGALAEAGAGEVDRGRLEGVGEDQVGAGGDVVLVELAHEVARLEDRDGRGAAPAAGTQLGAGGAVGEDHAAIKRVEEGVAHRRSMQAARLRRYDAAGHARRRREPAVRGLDPS